MTEYTATAFKWTGTYYNNTYNTSYTATFQDDDNTYEGGGDGNETVSIDGGAPMSTDAQPYAIDVSFTDTEGDQHVETFNFFQAGNEWYFVPKEGSAFSEGATLGDYQSHTEGWEYSSVVCFANGTEIETARGPCLVEHLQQGDLVATLDHGLIPLRWNIRRDVTAQAMRRNRKLRPVRIGAGALGCGLPYRDLRLSRQHRMMSASPISRRMFGDPAVLIAARHLADLPGCMIEPEPDALTYHHLIFDRHVVLWANGAPSESFYAGDQALRSLPVAARRNLPASLTPNPSQHRTRHLAPAPAPARPIPDPADQKDLIARHLKNAKPLLALPLHEICPPGPSGPRLSQRAGDQQRA